jgi:hypothetical protein
VFVDQPTETLARRDIAVLKPDGVVWDLLTAVLDVRMVG